MLINKYNQTLNMVRFGIDMFFVLAAWIVSFFIRFESGLIATPLGDDSLRHYLILTPPLLISYALVFSATGIYQRSLERRRVLDEHLDLAKSHALAFILFVTATYFLYNHRFSRITLALFFCIAPLFLASGRSILRKCSRFLLNRMNPTGRAVVVGSGDLAKRVSTLVEESKEWRLKLVATIPGDQAPSVKQLLEQDSIDVVFIAASTMESPYLQSIYDSLGNTMAEIIVIPDFGTPTFLAPRTISLAQYVAVAINTSNLNRWGALQKRIFDLLFSTVFIICFSWLFVICALLVRLSSPGPIFYRQERMGIDGRTFNLLKFRGMYANAEANSGPVWAKAADHRTTPIGKWLRRTSLDEIPQFINVLLGEMSIVGPRPERPVFVAEFRHKIPGYMLRHKVRAGITGWAQINGWRGNTSLEKRIECDLWYVQNWSLLLDIKICFLTPFKGLIHPNAY